MRALFYILFVIVGSWISSFSASFDVNKDYSKTFDLAHFSNPLHANTNVYEVLEIAEDIGEDDENELATKKVVHYCLPTSQIFDHRVKTTIQVFDKALKPTQELYILYNCSKDYLS